MEEKTELKPLNPKSFLESWFKDKGSDFTSEYPLGSTVSVGEALNWMKAYSGFYQHMAENQSLSKTIHAKSVPTKDKILEWLESVGRREAQYQEAGILDHIRDTIQQYLRDHPHEPMVIAKSVSDEDIENLSFEIYPVSKRGGIYPDQDWNLDLRNRFVKDAKWMQDRLSQTTEGEKEKEEK